MKTIFDKATRDELIARIDTINENSVAQWGKMNVYQMLKHNILWGEMIFGKLKCKRVFMGRIIGKMALKSALKDDAPMMRNAVTSPELKVKETTGDIASLKKKWMAQLQGFALFSDPGFIHPFFGQMTKEEVGYHAYKHIDHHLRQFNG
jgi:hypothetical protein